MKTLHANKFLTAAVLVILGAAAVIVWRASAGTVVPAGVDEFQTPPNATSFEPWNLPAGFFTNANGSPSNELYNATIYYKGGDPVPGYSADTVIKRVSDVDVPGSTDLEVVGLRFVSTSPLAITFADGTTAYYQINVEQSSKYPSAGVMDLYLNPNSFVNSLDINRKYICTAAGQPTNEFESVDVGWEAIHLSGEGTWSFSGTRLGISRGGVSIKPKTEQGILEQHGLVPPSSPTPSPTKTAIVIDALRGR
ncbi:MAG TPA: hypothetical protein VFV34_26460 [Blastocatellia bacterium]|nr:hypothetical protein [Blastocatellia bacterium]